MARRVDRADMNDAGLSRAPIRRRAGEAASTMACAPTSLSTSKIRANEAELMGASRRRHAVLAGCGTMIDSTGTITPADVVRFHYPA